MFHQNVSEDRMHTHISPTKGESAVETFNRLWKKSVWKAALEISISKVRIHGIFKRGHRGSLIPSFVERLGKMIPGWKDEFCVWYLYVQMVEWASRVQILGESVPLTYAQMLLEMASIRLFSVKCFLSRLGGLKEKFLNSKL